MKRAIAAVSLFAATNFAAQFVVAQSARQSVTLYGGPATRQYVSHILHGDFDIDGTMVGLAYDRRLANLGAGFVLEGELQVNHFFMTRPYSSVAAGLGVRYDLSRWLRYPTSFAFYTGPSYADDFDHGGGEQGHLLEYVSLELVIAGIDGSPWDAVIRMFHRSGAFGLYGMHTDTGSMVGVGLRRRF